ncbi:MAG: TIGR02453 family protein [Gemmatimonadaceae bacterium]|nr:TIGR02453 family protein [Acetobacteraceae bacterium]
MRPPRKEATRSIKRAAGFEGFGPAAYRFLIELGLNNTKVWFEANRSTYEVAVKLPVAALVVDVAAELTRRGLPLEGDPKRSGFRINRDTRFSNDKSPYKTQVGSVWYRQGSGKDGAGVLYFHFAPEGCFAAAAFYRPEPEVLGAIRERIRVHPDRFLAMQDALTAAGLALDESDALTRMPRGFEDLKDSPVASAIRQRSFIVQQPISLDQTKGPALVSAIADLAAGALPLLQFGWAAVDEAGG